MTDSYVTVSGTACEEIVINKSRFIGYVSPCSSESDALAFLQHIREEHKTATHHCYAYIVGENSGIMRYSDDGEPGGTAGLPIMDAMRTKSIVNCCIVVVRYFGGTLLGTGGLVRAYTQSAQAALSASGIVRMEKTALYSCILPYSAWDKFRYASERHPVKIQDTEYSSMLRFRLALRSGEADHLLQILTDASDRTLSSSFEEETYAAWECD
jgi:uncharacterized YigZ family protein